MSEQKTRHIAIIGAGISGLASAYYCAKIAQQKNQPVQIKIFERNASVGGNVQTRVASLGMPYDDKILPGTDYYRWVDLGVNDINLATYDKTVAVMKAVGYYSDDETSQNLLPLESTTCYFSLDGRVTFTDDTDLRVGVSDPRYSLDQIDSGVLPKLSEIINQLALKEIYPPDGKYAPGEESLDITLGQFFDQLLDNTAVAFDVFDDEIRREIDANWKSHEGIKKLRKKIILLRDCQFYPRIAAMYFANDYGPQDMLLAAPFLYYCIQEGIGSNSQHKKPADRRYFVGGSQRWIEYLGKYLQHDMDDGSGLVDIQLVLNVDVSVQVCADKVIVKDCKKINGSEEFDRVIMTTHADDAQQAIQFEQQEAHHGQADLCQQESQIRQILASISYTSSVAVAHTFSGVLSPNRNAWRCYNVLIREGVSLKPYSMTYVCNRHQNDAQNPVHQRFGFPQYFVTLNPHVPIPDECVLQQADEHEIPSHIADILPQSTLALAAQDSSSQSVTRKKCVTTFKHNLLNKNCFLAQRALRQFHQDKTRIFFAGGWTNGAGLHEECFFQAEFVAKKIFS